VFNKKGFSFLEILVAAAVLIVIIAMASSVLIFSLKNQVNAERAFYAVFLAQEKAEELKTIPWNQLISEPETEISGYPGFNRRVDIQNPAPQVKQITVQVFYPLYHGKIGVQVIVFERTVDLH
ncbi:MAG: type IV pilus modification PilV family protein, partial [Arcobacter sp.]